MADRDDDYYRDQAGAVMLGSTRLPCSRCGSLHKRSELVTRGLLCQECDAAILVAQARIEAAKPRVGHFPACLSLPLPGREPAACNCAQIAGPNKRTL